MEARVDISTVVTNSGSVLTTCVVTKVESVVEEYSVVISTVEFKIESAAVVDISVVL